MRSTEKGLFHDRKGPSGIPRFRSGLSHADPDAGTAPMALYHVTDLNFMSSPSPYAAVGLNNSGQVVGELPSARTGSKAIHSSMTAHQEAAGL